MERYLLMYALPFFALAIGVDYLLDLTKKSKRYDIADSISSLGAGFLGTTSGILTTGLAGFFYLSTFHWLHLFAIDNSVGSWILAALVYDFLYYFYHRAHHRINILWAAHAAHHNSEYFNFTTALRQSSLVFLTTWPFFMPMALLGFTFPQYLFGAALSVIYGFFTHTEHLRYIPYFEYVFVGPSSHRVHHGINAGYVDKNFGSILNLWDRLFGTYAPEVEVVTFGTLTALNSFNPFHANLAVYGALARDFIHTRSWRDKLRLWWAETGWRPAECGPTTRICGPRTRFESPAQPLEVAYCAFNFVLLAAATAFIMMTAAQHPQAMNIIYICLVWSGLASLGLILDRRPLALAFEILRLLLIATVAQLAL